jgi:4-hydroxy-tetrahydrodipicolinate reductase
MTKSLRVLAVGLGPLGVKIAADLHRRRLGEVVAAVDPACAGERIGDVTIVDSLERVTEPVDVAVVATVSDLPGCAPILRALAARGISAVSTCEELSWPWERHPALARELAAIAQRHGVRMLGTGVNPGFVMDALAVAVTTACAEVRRVEIHRIQDASTRRLPFQKKIGATLAVAEFDRLAATQAIRHVGLRESVGMVATTLGLPFDRVDETIAPVIAEHAMTCGLGPIAAGAARGVHQEARAYHGDREVIALVFRAAIGEPEPRDHIRVDGDPEIDLVIRNGLHGDVATSAVVLNSIRSLLAAPPGLHTMTTIAMAGCSTVAR